MDFILIVNKIRWTGTWHPLGSYVCLNSTSFFLPDVAMVIWHCETTQETPQHLDNYLLLGPFCQTVDPAAQKLDNTIH